MTWKAQGFRHVSQASGPAQPERYRAIGEHLTRDREQGRLTLKGPDLAYWLAFARPGDLLRAWVMTALDARIMASTLSRIDERDVMAAHICQHCGGRGVDGDKEACESCGATGFVCPVCRGARWLTNGRTAPMKVTACPGCMVNSPTGYAVSTSIEARTIQTFLNRQAAINV